MEKAKSLGLKVILDFVPNYSSHEHGLDWSVDGFRTDAISHLFENTCYLDQPRKNIPEILEDDYKAGSYLHGKSLPEIYEVLSYYSVFKSLSRLETKLVKWSSLEAALYCFNCSITENVLGVVWRHDASVVAFIVNFVDTPVTVDTRIWMNIPEQLIVYAPSVHSEKLAGSRVDAIRITMPSLAFVVLNTTDLV
ncbi:hypothetical protein ALC62_14639 [Cyphomyrmex costatus]|uniref:Uncharacterized protein n=1 Tax=Cyphomyrmex costatus TaxID=456900 RepID=A0A195C1A5_9HYME|nr:hypothetical protein ALC62_14639 [Cyphomyrmex costatus]